MFESFAFRLEASRNYLGTRLLGISGFRCPRARSGPVYFSVCFPGGFETGGGSRRLRGFRAFFVSVLTGRSRTPKRLVTLRCVPGTLQMHKGFWLVRRRVPGMQRSVTGPFVAFLAPFNALRLFAGASKGPRHATKGHGTLRCGPLAPFNAQSFWMVRRRVPGMPQRSVL